MAYLPNAPQHSRQIHQRGHSSLRSSSSTIQSSQTVSPVPGPSIVSVNNDPNWKDAPTNSITNNIANRPTSSTCSWSKPCWSDNTNEQLAEVLGQLANTLNLNQTSGSAIASQNKANPSPVASSTKNSSSKSFLSPTLKKQSNTLWVDFSSKLASNGKLTSDKHKKHLENNLCLYCSTRDHKLDSCLKKQTMVSPKVRSASTTANTSAAASKKSLEK